MARYGNPQPNLQKTFYTTSIRGTAVPAGEPLGAFLGSGQPDQTVELGAVYQWQ